MCQELEDCRSLSLAPLPRCQTFWRLVNRACPKLTHWELLLLCPCAISSPLFQHLHWASACKFKDLKSERQLAVTEVFIEKMFHLVTVLAAEMDKSVTAEARWDPGRDCVCAVVFRRCWATKPTAMGSCPSGLP